MMSATPLQRYVYYYYQDGNKSRETFTDANGAVHTWEWVYDQLGRLVNEVHDNADDSLDYITLYKYDLVGNRLEKRTDHGNDGVFEEIIKGTFDRNDRLLNEMRIFNGTPLEKTDYVFNKTEQIAKTVTNLVSSEMESKTTLQYDEQGRLSKIVIDTYTNGAHTQSVTQEYFYDSNGIKIRQVEKVDANADGVVDATRETTYLNDNQNHTGYSQVLEERLVENGEEVKVTTYTIGHDVLAQFDTVAGYLSLFADGHGSTRAVANATGAIVQQYNYDAYGNAHGFKPSEALTNLLYSGEQFNPVSGLQYLRARWYNPQSGRFNRLDPYSGNQMSPLSFHKYAYGHMNPIGNIDPSGMWSLVNLAISTAISQTLSTLSSYIINPIIEAVFEPFLDLLGFSLDDVLKLLPSAAGFSLSAGLQVGKYGVKISGSYGYDGYFSLKDGKYAGFETWTGGMNFGASGTFAYNVAIGLVWADSASHAAGRSMGLNIPMKAITNYRKRIEKIYANEIRHNSWHLPFSEGSTWIQAKDLIRKALALGIDQMKTVTIWTSGLSLDSAKGFFVSPVSSSWGIFLTSANLLTEDIQYR